MDLKPQLRAMGVANALALTATAAATDVTTAGFAVAAVGLIGKVAGPAVDVRIAGWLLHPDAGELSCGVGKNREWASLGVGGRASHSSPHHRPRNHSSCPSKVVQLS